jgi:23S rRNA (guanosine2251-2'-O)-methyltransferase
VARVSNLTRALADLTRRGFWSVGAVAEGAPSLYEAPDRTLRGDLVVVLGGEATGLRRGTLEGVDHPLRIPMRGEVASLNVATAAAVILFEIRRRWDGLGWKR